MSSTDSKPCYPYQSVFTKHGKEDAVHDESGG